MNNKNILLFHFLNIWGSDLKSFGSPKQSYTNPIAIFLLCMKFLKLIYLLIFSLQFTLYINNQYCMGKEKAK